MCEKLSDAVPASAKDPTSVGQGSNATAGLSVADEVLVVATDRHPANQAICLVC